MARSSGTCSVLYQALNSSSYFGDRLRPQLRELTIFALTLLEPSGGVATNLRWASAIRAERTDSALCACPRERRDNSSTSASGRETLAHMTLAALMHPHHTVDAFHRTTGPYCVSQELIHTPIGTLPLRTQHSHSTCSITAS